jgi:protoheme IX farnesyltransferase
MWQVPHFWLLLLFSCGRDYEAAGIPSMTRIFSLEQIARMTFMWILATVTTCMAIPLSGIIDNDWINLGLFAAGLWLVWRSVAILRVPGGVHAFRVAFRHVNLYVLVVISMLSLGGIVG